MHRSVDDKKIPLAGAFSVFEKTRRYTLCTATLLGCFASACVDLTTPWERMQDRGQDGRPDASVADVSSRVIASRDANKAEDGKARAGSDTTGTSNPSCAASSECDARLTAETTPSEPVPDGSTNTGGAGGSPDSRRPDALLGVDSATITGGAGGARDALAAEAPRDSLRSSDTSGIDSGTGLSLFKLSGSTFGTGPAFSSNPSMTYDKAFDSNLATFFDDSHQGGGYTGIGLSNGKTEIAAVIRYYPRKDFNDRMVGGKFQCSSSSQTDGYVDLYTVSSVPPLGWSEVPIANAPPCRYFRYLCGTYGFTNVADIEFWATGNAEPGRIPTDPLLVNLSQDRPVQAGGAAADKPTKNGNDGLPLTMYCPASSGFPVWYQVDLGESSRIKQTTFTVEYSAATYYYRIEVSSDGTNWTNAVNHETNAVFGPATLTDNFQAQGRYVRLTITGVSSGSWKCIREFAVWG